MAKGPRVHSPEFKLRAVERMRVGENVSALASELRVSRRQIRGQDTKPPSETACEFRSFVAWPWGNLPHAARKKHGKVQA